MNLTRILDKAVKRGFCGGTLRDFLAGPSAHISWRILAKNLGGYPSNNVLNEVYVCASGVWPRRKIVEKAVASSTCGGTHRDFWAGPSVHIPWWFLAKNLGGYPSNNVLNEVYVTWFKTWKIPMFWKLHLLYMLPSHRHCFPHHRPPCWGSREAGGRLFGPEFFYRG